MQLLQSTDHSYELRAFGSLDLALEKGLGYCPLKDGEVVSRAFFTSALRNVWISRWLDNNEAMVRNRFAPSCGLRHLLFW